MAFDAGMLAAAIDEIRRESSGARVEKVYQPEKDEIIIQIRYLRLQNIRLSEYLVVHVQ